MKTATKELYSKRAAHWFSQLFEVVGDALYPRICPVCGTLSDRADRHLCWNCFSRIDLLTAGLCSLCGNPLTGVPASVFICQTCRQSTPAFDRARSAARFSGVMRDMLHSFKYGNALWLKKDLADIMHGALMAEFEYTLIDVVVPVPLFRTRFRERSYNQALVLAASLAALIDRRIDSRSLKRIRGTGTQTQFNSAQRKKNMAGAFKVVRPEWIRGKTILLVDDVMTTGATLSECARELKRAGSHQVFAISAARR